MITIKNLHFNYLRNKKPVIDRLCSVLLPGQIYGLLGLNGAGKTTLLKLIAGIAFPKEGKIQVFDKIPKERKIDFLSDIYFFEDEVKLPFWSLQKWLKIYSSIYTSFDHVLFDELLSQFDVDPDMHISNLSYGQKKKLNIAFGLATRARVLLMDEPTNGLDIPSKSQLRKVLAKHTHEDAIIIISTHQIRDIHPLIDHLLILKDHHFVVDQTVEQLSKLFKVTATPQEQDTVIYSEESLYGKKYVVKTLDNLEENVFDIELFFNAIMTNPDSTTIPDLNNTKTYASI
ncbi:ABC transporter ATP-binding protein [Sphingobacterium tabacisoli]|uniref:ATP-binding cassette domain-containing protein n=1 Tax=Sphingobacterium tabacisoli TaxID=2044855 RepID=A0ABW5L9X0_9SPHI|nr:ABC transporter ATP-binding protein [Sphingobacterium tabacisoli]